MVVAVVGLPRLVLLPPPKIPPPLLPHPHPYPLWGVFWQPPRVTGGVVLVLVLVLGLRHPVEELPQPSIGVPPPAFLA